MTSAQNKWQMALKSGQWRQGFGELRNRDGGHCCLGVAIAADVVPDGYGEGNSDDGELELSTSLNYTQQRLLALTYRTEEALVALNDAGISHREIADGLIEFWLTGDPSHLRYLG